MQQSQNEKTRTYYGRYVQKEQLSAGSFGIVYICQDKFSRELVAVKVEKENSDLMSLDREIQIIEELRGVVGVPRLYWYGTEYNTQCMAMQLLGRDLAHQLKKFRKFTLKCVCNLAEQLINILEEVHKRGVIHRDIKPENILMGRGQEANQVYLVDYGISKKFRVNGQHIPFQENKPFIGTTRYASIAAHKGYEIARKDDLESLGYVFLFLLKGNLPWQNITSSNDKEKTKLVGKLKMELQPKELCKGQPAEFQRYFDYVFKLKFNQSPDYKYLLNLIRQMASSNNFQLDRKFDWLEGTATTKSSDTKDPRESLSDLTDKLQSDMLKLPDPKHSPHGNRRKSVGIESQIGSQQSSVMLNYVPSMVMNQPRGLGKDKKTINSRQSSLSRESSLQKKIIVDKTDKSIKIDPLYNRNQYFQDLEARENKARSPKMQQQPRRKKSEKREDTIMDDFDMDDDDEVLFEKVQQVQQLKVHFKEKLQK